MVAISINIKDQTYDIIREYQKKYNCNRSRAVNDLIVAGWAREMEKGWKRE